MVDPDTGIVHGENQSLRLTYYNDGSNPDPYPSPWGTYPFTASDTVSHTYGDNGVYTITLTVTDDDGGMTSTTVNVTIENVSFGPGGMAGPLDGPGLGIEVNDTSLNRLCNDSKTRTIMRP